MNIFQRLSATLHSRIDNAVSHIENNDAIVEVALRDARSAIAKARVRLARVQKDGAALRSKQAQLQQETASWESRAKQVAEADEAKALSCIERRNRCQTQLGQTNEALARHEQMEQKMKDSIAQLERKQQDLHQQRNLMRSRHSAADAMRVLRTIEAQNPTSGLDDAFERWEMQIIEAEYAYGDAVETDTLEASFVAEEDSEKLKADLHALLHSDNTKQGE